MENSHGIQVLLSKPQDYDAAQFLQIEKLVLSGEEIDSHNLSQRLMRANIIAAVLMKDSLVGVGAIKRPGRHRETLIRLSGYRGLANYSGEVGYLYVIPEHRKKGIGAKIFHVLLEKFCEPVYGTTRTDNDGMHRILMLHSFTAVGNEWDSTQHPGKKIRLWVGPQ